MLITLTTDFGYQDSFVGVMKGVIAGINPQAQIIDLTHGVPPQQIMVAALTLRYAIDYFPEPTIHVAVIDPGVGSARRPLLIQRGKTYLVGPDNGVLSLALGRSEPDCVIHLCNPSYHRQPTSATFHGRDIFAPVAAYLALGTPALAFGDRVAEFARLPLPVPRRSGTSIEGEILYIDHFGNLFTNIDERELAGFRCDKLTVSLGTLSIRGLAASYSAVPAGNYVALINSWGLLEIAIYKDSAQKRLQAKVGDKIRVTVDS
jgi:S-adenosylmethionine hydrolase